MSLPTSVLLGLALLAAPERPLTELPYTPGLDVTAMDRTVDPCVDFYSYACGGWQRNNPIPDDQSSWNTYSKMSTDNQRFLWGLLETAAARPDGERSAVERKVGDFFASCMDEKAVELAGVKPLEADLAAIEGLKSTAAMASLVAQLHQRVDGALMFTFDSTQSLDNSEVVMAELVAGGLGMPDRDYYLKADARSRELRAAYLAVVEESLRLSGWAQPRAAVGAKTVLRIETALAQASLSQADRRDPAKVWHRTRVAEWVGRSPAFHWVDYLAAAGARKGDVLNVTEPAYFAELDRQLTREPLVAWQTYLRWHLLRASSPFLSAPFQKANFNFYEQALRGSKALAPRWRRCVGWTDAYLGEALGKLFVDRVFPPSARTDAETMIRWVEKAMAARLDALEWMGPQTRAAAHQKLAAMKNKIGYPKTWRDYGPVTVRRGDLAGNVARGMAFEFRRQLAKVGRPVDREEWLMTPPTVDAYYSWSMNEMNFPAAVLLPPLWDPHLDLAPGYGNTAATVGHELTHGFDDQGRKFDAHGDLRDWWTKADAEAFERRSRCVGDQYARYTVVDDVKINSQLTRGEDIADLGGAVLAWDAWKLATAGQKLEPRDGLTPEQRFFVGNAQWACGNVRPETLRLLAVTNPHSPTQWRVNGVVVNMPQFAKAFSCRAGQPMVSQSVCQVW